MATPPAADDQSQNAACDVDGGDGVEWDLSDGPRMEALLQDLQRHLPAQPDHADGRIYVNRSVSMSKTKAIGFDMDYTLVEYKSPEYETLSYNMIVRRLIDVGYPKVIGTIPYSADFPVRGLLFDKIHGNLIKVDGFGNILEVFHGFSCLSVTGVRQLYPNLYAPINESRYHVLNTLFELPETFLLAALVDYFDNHPEYTKTPFGVEFGSVTITYESIQGDVRQATDWVHREGLLKSETVNNLEKYIAKEPKLPLMLDRLRDAGIIVFLATNSQYKYTDSVLSYMFDLPEIGKRSWKSYFDYIFVDAQKPRFFQEGTTLREVDEATGSLKLGQIRAGTGLERGKVYAGGSSDLFCRFVSISGKNILYVGDHIFGDIIKSKKQQAMRTFLVIPELRQEVQYWEETKGFYLHLQRLEMLLRETCFAMASSNPIPRLPDSSHIQRAIKATSQQMEECRVTTLGSLLRCGPRQTFFAYQATRFADLYGTSCTNLLNYAPGFHFIAPHSLMPHENFHLSEVPSGGLLPLSPTLETRPLPKRFLLTKTTPVDFADDEEDGPNGVGGSDQEETLPPPHKQARTTE